MLGLGPPDLVALLERADIVRGEGYKVSLRIPAGLGREETARGVLKDQRLN